MSKIWVIGLVALLVGGLIGAFVFPTTETKEVKVNVPVEKVVNVEVPVPVPDASLVLNSAVSDFLSAVEDEEDEAGNSVDALTCDGDDYDFEEVSVSKLEDNWTLTYLDEDEYTVDFEAKLKYKQDDLAGCKASYAVNVHYEEDEDTEVTVVAL